MKKLLLFSIIFLTAFGCKSTKDLNGQYIGVMTQEGIEKSVVVFVNSNGSALKTNSIDVTVNELNVNKNPQGFNFKINRDGEVVFNYNGKSYDLNFDKNDSCITSNEKGIKFNLCLDKNNMNLNFIDSYLESNSFKLIIKRSSDLSSLNNNQSSYNIEELLGRAKFLNFTLIQNAETVYRSKQNVKGALGNLLPHISTNDILGFATAGPVAFVSSVGNLVPFIFPSNWFQFKEAKELNIAEKLSYASLRGNVVNGVEGLLYIHVRNTALLNMLSNEISWLNNILSNIKLKEDAGAAPQGASEYFSMKVGTLDLDLEQIKLFVDMEGTEISHAVNLPMSSKFSINNPVLPDLSEAKPIAADQCTLAISKKSFEIEALDHMIKASKYQTDERIFSILDPNSGGLGFGTPSTIRIGQSYERELESQKEEMISILNKSCTDSTNERNSSLRSFRIADQYLKNAYKIREILSKRMLRGDSLSESILDELASNADDVLKYESQKYSALIQFVISEGKLNRLMLTGNYSNLEVGI